MTGSLSPGEQRPLRHSLFRDSAHDDGTIGGAGLDVYEEESEWFYEDRSDVTRQNKTISLLVSMPNVIVTSHQAFLTYEALANIAQTTLANLDAYFSGAPLENKICYRCLGTGGANKSDCPRRNGGRCSVSAISQG